MNKAYKYRIYPTEIQKNIWTAVCGHQEKYGT